MCLFKKRKGSVKQVLANQDQLLNNSKFAESLVNYAGIDNKTAIRISDIADKLKYMNPSSKSEVATIDRKIENKLSDLKIEISANNINQNKVDTLIKDLTNLVADRDFQSKKN